MNPQPRAMHRNPDRGPGGEALEQGLNREIQLTGCAKSGNGSMRWWDRQAA